MTTTENTTVPEVVWLGEDADAWFVYTDDEEVATEAVCRSYLETSGQLDYDEFMEVLGEEGFGFTYYDDWAWEPEGDEYRLVRHHNTLRLERFAGMRVTL